MDSFEILVPSRAATASENMTALWNRSLAFVVSQWNKTCAYVLAHFPILWNGLVFLLAVSVIFAAFLHVHIMKQDSFGPSSFNNGAVEEAWVGSFKERSLFILGDSTVAAGNFEMTVFPYGVDLPSGSTNNTGSASGRFSNGYTIADYTAIENGSPIPVPYRTMGKEKSSVPGINFASGGCGILDWTRPPIPHFSCTSLSGQVKQLFDLDLNSSTFKKAVFFISVASNDYQFSYHGKDPEGFGNELVNHLKNTLKSLYARGANKFLINNVGSIGCIPNNRMLINKDCYEEKCSVCDEVKNQGTEVYNRKLEVAVREVAKEVNATFVIANSQNIFKELIHNHSKLGFQEILKPCCGKWNTGMQMYLCSEKAGLCKNRTTTLFWDGAHTTDAANKLFVKRCFTGTICHHIY